MRISGKPLVALLAEASFQIGSGHLIETFNIARAAQRVQLPVVMRVNKDAPVGLLEHAPVPVGLVSDFSAETLAREAMSLVKQGCSLVITNFRRVTDAQVQALQAAGLKVVCIDELGNTHLNCDLVVNTSIVTDYHHYTSTNPNFRFVAGPKYLAMTEEFQSLNQRARVIRNKIQSLVITMGGTNPTGTTAKIVEALAGGTTLEIEKHVVVGGGFAHAAELEVALSRHRGANVIVHRNLKSLAELLARSDVGFTVGGNTLSEMACVGTTALVLYEMPHEKDQAMAFQDRGFGVCVGSAVDTFRNVIVQALEYVGDRDFRERSSRVGRELVDGRGAQRILVLSLNLIGYQCSGLL